MTHVTAVCVCVEVHYCAYTLTCLYPWLWIDGLMLSVSMVEDQHLGVKIVWCPWLWTHWTCCLTCPWLWINVEGSICCCLMPDAGCVLGCGLTPGGHLRYPHVKTQESEKWHCYFD